MKHIKLVSRVFLFCLLMTTTLVFGQSTKSVTGAWEARVDNRHIIVLLQDGYFTKTSYEKDKFIKTMGGPYTMSVDKIAVKLEFDSEKNETVGETYEMDLIGFKQIDNGKAPLAGVWHITDRMQEGNLVPIQRSGTRKTLKVLTGNRFQWFAIDPGTKGFMGTGGGTYSFENGRYTENIEFFSRDNSRVGAQLGFEGTIKQGKWHHSGLSSKGDKIYEVWGKVE